MRFVIGLLISQQHDKNYRILQKISNLDCKTKIKCVSITWIILDFLHFIFLKKHTWRYTSTLIFGRTFDSTQSLEEILTDFNELISFANSIFRPLKVSGPHLESTFLDSQICHLIFSAMAKRFLNVRWRKRKNSWKNKTNNRVISSSLCYSAVIFGIFWCFWYISRFLSPYNTKSGAEFKLSKRRT